MGTAMVRGAYLMDKHSHHLKAESLQTDKHLKMEPSKFETVNPEPENPEPRTRNLRTRNPEPGTRNHSISEIVALPRRESPCTQAPSPRARCRPAGRRPCSSC